MPSLIDGKSSIPRNRLLTAIALIMIVEHKTLVLDELMKATGMSFKESIDIMQNLVNTRLVEVIPTKKSIPSFKLINEGEAQKFLELAGIYENATI
ncbi:MAG: hypothetical protein ACW99A_02475 [Candidatus Kariarchaeaceae archaeon]|jgi:hypothetical protein